MLRLTVDQLQPGMVTARNIFSANGKLLLAQNIILDEPMISRLETMGIDSVFVNHPFLEIEPQEIINEATRIETIKLTHRAFEHFEKKQTLNLMGIHQVMRKVIEDVLENRYALVHLTDIRIHGDYTFGHAINVCLLSVMMGVKMQLGQQELYELAMGAILHDLGMMLVPADIRDKDGPLSSDEQKIVKGHTEDGFNILRKVGPIPLVSAHVAYQHHESADGSGYPRGLSGESIHLYARIAAVADLYDAITSDRPYRKAFPQHEAYEIMQASRGSRLDAQLVSFFLESVALYPMGATVLLDTGEIGVVVEVFPKLQARPRVKVIADKAGRPWTGPEKVVDLTKDLIRSIVKVLSPEEIFQARNMGKLS
ncbi:MAG: HD-GYP domain-containing protein [Sporomusaceae bacterium]|nr:HD-GYP domain-containing protein [Sporomusaceae bacterium]